MVELFTYLLAGPREDGADVHLRQPRRPGYFLHGALFHVAQPKYPPGRVGQAAARMLDRNEVPFLVMDTDVPHIERAKKNNREYLFGNAANIRILEAANISKAKAVMICISGVQSAMHVLQAVREISSNIPVFIRCNDDTRWSELVRLGATGVISETQECGIRLAYATILCLDGDEDRLRETAAVLRQENTINASLPTASGLN